MSLDLSLVPFAVSDYPAKTEIVFRDGNVAPTDSYEKTEKKFPSKAKEKERERDRDTQARPLPRGRRGRIRTTRC